VELWIEYAPWLAVMAVLLVASAFFSASEAALFSLSRRDRRRLAAGGRGGRIAAGLLADIDRLLTAVLFWNLLVNLTYFTLGSIVSLQWQRGGSPTAAGSLALVALLACIFFGELLPKSLAVGQPLALAGLLAVPLAAAIRLVDPVLPALRLAHLLSRRLLWPRFQAEPYLRTSDLERAVRLSTTDAALLAQGQRMLESIVSLAEIRADELMRPRVQLRTFRPPVSLADLRGPFPASGYLLVVEPESEEVAGAIALRNLSVVPEEHLERYAEPVVYVPWCMTAAAALETLRRHNRRVAAVVNELGETIGILPVDDILDTIFSDAPSRSQRLLRRQPIRQVRPDTWQVTGMTSLRRLVRHFQVPMPPSKSVTVSGAVQEALERLPQPGDECRWGPFQMRVLEVPERGQLLVELTLVEEQAP
jgi:CBS domain containing-hemolysin-like protein